MCLVLYFKQVLAMDFGVTTTSAYPPAGSVMETMIVVIAVTREDVNFMNSKLIILNFMKQF